MNAPHVLIDLLGACWESDAAVVEVVWDTSGQYAGFALGDGTLGLATGVWQGGPRLKPRENGGVEFVHAQAPPAPLARMGVHEGTCLALAADPAGGFLSGGDDGRLVHLRLDGTSELVAHEADAWIDRVAASPVSGRSYACGRRVHWLGPKPACLMISGSATSMAFDPGGTRLAISHHGGVTLWAADTLRERELVWPGYHRNLAWSPDGRYLVSGMEENALHGWRLSDAADIEMAGYPGQPRSLSFSADGRFLATSGGMRAVCWRFDPPRADDKPHESGIAGKTPVSRVACHPVHPLIAVGYHSGEVLLCQPGSSDILLVKGSGNGAVSAMAWSPDGRRLALGTGAGELALVFLPDELFRFGRRRQTGDAPLTYPDGGNHE